MLEVEKLLIAKLGESDIRAIPHIELKVKVWKQKYYSIFDIMDVSGVGWNEITKTDDCPDEYTWKLLLKVIKLPLSLFLIFSYH